jgi:restriction system protein
MPVPDFQCFFVPVLRALDDGLEHPTADLRGEIGNDLKLTHADLSEKLPSGRRTVFTNRLAWSTVYLTKAGALERIRPGAFKITTRGRDLMELRLPKITVRNLSRFPEFGAFYRGSQSAVPVDAAKTERTETPAEQLAQAYKILRDAARTPDRVSPACGGDQP